MKWPRYFPALAAALILTVPSVSLAEFKVRIQIFDENGTSISDETIADGSTLDSAKSNSKQIQIDNYSPTDSGVSIKTQFTRTNLPGNSELAFVSWTDTLVENTANQLRTVKITMAAADFSSPVSPPDPFLKGSFSATAAPESSGSVDLRYESWVYSGDTVDLSGAQQKSGQMLTADLTAGSSKATSPDLATNTFYLSDPFGISVRLTYTLGSGEAVEGSSGFAKVVLPGPGGLALALVAVPFVGYTYLRRRLRP